MLGVVGQQCCVASVCTIVSPSNFTAEERERFPSNRFQNVIRVLTIKTDNPGGNLVQKHKTIKFNVVGEQPATKYPKSALQTWKSRKIASSQITDHIFTKLPHMAQMAQMTQLAQMTNLVPRAFTSKNNFWGKSPGDEVAKWPNWPNRPNWPKWPKKPNHEPTKPSFYY